MLTDHHDVANILAIVQDYICLYQEITLDDLQYIVNPKVLSKDQEDLLQQYEKLNHAPYSQMRNLAKHSILPKLFKNIYLPPLCLSCTFGVLNHKAWQTKDGFNHIKKDLNNTSSSIVAVD